MKLLKFTCIITSSLILTLCSTGCSYLSDMVEAAITDRASFSATAEYIGGNVIIEWDETDYSENFAGIEIYRTSEPNDEYCDYTLIANQFTHPTRNLDNGGTTSFIYTPTSLHGVYFFRVGFIHWDEDEDDRTIKNGYIGDTETDYYNHTDINAISGYARVVIP